MQTRLSPQALADSKQNLEQQQYMRCERGPGHSLSTIIRPIVVFLAIFLSVVFLWGCTSQETGENRQNHSAPEKRRVVYRLKWLINASTLGDIWAREQGFFASTGLDVTIKEGGAEHDAIEEIELGRADFGVASGDQVIRAVSRGADCVVIAQIFQENPLQWIYNSSRVSLDLEHPARSLKELTIGITYGGNDEAIFMALAGRLGLEPEKLNIYAITYDYTPFWKGKVDLWPCYRNTQGITLQEKMERQGERAGFFDPCKYGVRFVANSLVTSRKFLRSHPETVKLFRKAVIRGWKSAIEKENLQKAAALLSRYEKGLARDILKRQIEATAPLITGHGKFPVGYIDTNAWQQTESIMFRQGLIKKRVDVQGLLVSEEAMQE